jgi:RNase P/RNase MRP subunit POP5
LTVRDKVGRTRYIGFLLESARRVGRDEVTRELADESRQRGVSHPFQLTVFDGGRGILKVPHVRKNDFIAILSSLRAVGRDRVPVQVRTVVTSGTICTVKERMGIPPERPPPRHAARHLGGGPRKP